MIDSELLKFAAKAAGIEPVYCYESRRNCLRIGDKKSYSIWSPLTDDGDAFRLAVALEISTFTHHGESCDAVSGDSEKLHVVNEAFSGCSYRDMRRAIVRVAAEIGRLMP